jgi:uncharacterized membrane protein
MTWKRRHRLTSFLGSSLWIIPVGSVVLHVLLSSPIHALDAWLGWAGMGLGVEGARALCNAVITLALSFVVFTFGSLLVAVQVAGGQYTPRIIATTLLRNDVVRYSVGLFVFTLVFSIMALNRVERANDIMVVLTGLLGIACTATFLFLIDYAARLLRPVSILTLVAEGGLGVIKAVYPAPAGDTGDLALPPERPADMRRRVITHDGDSGILLAVDLPTLVREARRTDGFIEIVPHVGDFVATGQPLFVLYDGATAVPDEKVQVAVALGSERTLEQDPLFAFRIIVDIGLKALSPAINDPTTGVLALDQVHRLLRFVGRRQLLGETVVDSRGRVRVIYRTPDWEDFVHLSCHEIRTCGAGNIQIARRMRAMFDDLIATLPADRHPVLELESRLLSQAIRTHFQQPEDLALAETPDTQGLGGAVSARPRARS